LKAGGEIKATVSRMMDDCLAEDLADRLKDSRSAAETLLPPNSILNLALYALIDNQIYFDSQCTSSTPGLTGAALFELPELPELAQLAGITDCR